MSIEDLHDIAAQLHKFAEEELAPRSAAARSRRACTAVKPGSAAQRPLDLPSAALPPRERWLPSLLGPSLP